MHILDEKRVCGRADGPSYVEAVLPVPQEKDENGKFDLSPKECPQGYDACIAGSPNTYCYPSDGVKEDDCPITDILFVNTVKDAASSDQGLVKKRTELSAGGYKSIEFNDEFDIFYSK